MLIRLFRYLLSTAFLAIIFLNGCTGKDPLTPDERAWLNLHREKINVAIDPYWYPFEFIDRDGNYSGFTSEVFRLIEDKISFRFSFVPTKSWSDTVKKTETGQIHIWAGAAETPQRLEKMDFTSPYYSASTAIIVKNSLKGKLTLDKLSNRKVGVIGQYAVHHHLMKNYSSIKIIPMKTPEEALGKLNRNMVDALILSYPLTEHFLKLKKYSSFRIAGISKFRYHLCIASTRRMPFLGSILQKGLDMITDEEFVRANSRWTEKLGGSTAGLALPHRSFSIYLAAALSLIILSVIIFIIRKDRKAIAAGIKKITGKRTMIYTVAAVVAAVTASVLILHRDYVFTKDILTISERKWLNNLGRPLIFTPCPDYPPVDFIDDFGRYSGLTSDYLSALEKKLNYRFRIVHQRTWADLERSYKTGRADMVSSISRTPERLKYLNFTTPYFEAKTAFIVRKDFKGIIDSYNLKNNRISITRGYGVTDYIKKKYPGINLNYVDNDLEGLIKLSFSETDIMISDLPVATYLIDREKITNLRIADYTGHSYLISFAVRKELSQLHSILEKALSSISDEHKQDIHERWIRYDKQEFYTDPQFWLYLFISTGFILLIFLLVILWNRLLRKQVNKKTKEYEIELAERIKAEHSLLESRMLLSSLIKNIPGLVYRFRIDENRTIEFVSDKCMELTGHDAEYFTSESNSFLTIIHSDDIKHVVDIINECMSSGQPYETRYRITMPDSSVKWVLDIGGPVFEGRDEGSVSGFIGFITDITENRRKEIQLQQAQRMETAGTLAAGFAHDFNNLLGGIAGTLSLINLKLKKEFPESFDYIKDYFEIIKNSGLRAADMVKQLQILSRKEPVESTLLDLNENIINVKNLCRNTFDRSIEIRLCLPDTPSYTAGDPTGIEQVILNLCINSSHSMTIMRQGNETWGGILSISLKHFTADSFFKRNNAHARYQEYWKITISDTGIGMDDETLSRIFDPFFTTKDNDSGSGLGMTMAYNIVKQHRGFIKIYSEIGSGTSVSIYLPYIQSDSAETEILNEEVIHSGTGNILIAEDDETIKNILQDMLEECGYSVTASDDGDKCLDIYRTRYTEFHALIIDLVMPRMSGDTLVERVRKINPDAKIILTSGNPEDRRIKKLMDINNIAFIEKPFSISDISETLSSLLAEKNPE